MSLFTPMRAVFAAIVLVLLLALGVQSARLLTLQADYSLLQADVAKERQARADQRARDEAEARAKEHEIQERADAQRKADEQALRALGADRDRLVRLLRDRPYRPAPSGPVAPAAPAAGSGVTGATGAGLYREDGEFLAGEAAAAKRIAIERDSCLAQYQSAREALSKGQQP